MSMSKVFFHWAKLFSLLVPGLFISCSEDLDLEQSSFIRIYDSTDGDVSYDPIDIEATEEGYLILAGTRLNNTDFEGIQLITLTKTGDFQGQFTMNEEMVVPTGHLMQVDGRFYFFGMNSTTLRVVLISANADLSDIQTVTLGSLAYPLSASLVSNGNMLIESYDPEDGLTVLSEVQIDGTVVNSQGYSIGVGQDVEQNILSHYLESSVDLPFFCGESGAGQYYFNGFYNFSISMVFTDFGATPTGVIQGQSDDGGIRHAIGLSGNEFAVVGYQFDENYFVPNTSLSTSSITSSIDLFSGEQPEARTQTPASICQISDTEIVIASETESREIALYFYDITTSDLTGIETIGFLNPFTLGNVKMDAEGNLVVVGTTFVSGRFERLFLRKISNNDLQGFL